MSFDPFTSKVSHYVVAVKDWKMACALINYLKVNDDFSVIFERFINTKEFSLGQMLHINTSLRDVRADLSTIFRQLIDPKTKQFEEAEKFTPNDVQMRFIINVELLYHTIVIVEEHQYSLEYYQEESDGFAEAQDSLSTILVKIQGLFDEGRKVVRELLHDQKDNAVLLSWFTENRDNVAVAFGESIETLLTECFGFMDAADAYLKVGEYFLASGWGDRAKKALTLGARLKSKNADSNTVRTPLMLEKDQK